MIASIEIHVSAITISDTSKEWVMLSDCYGKYGVSLQSWLRGGVIYSLRERRGKTRV